jgi:DNA-directed RNA polymerase subunit M/transcription elongation factor TFIIS
MYYIKIDNNDSNKLVHYCRNCGDVNKDIVDNYCVSNVNIKKQVKNYDNYINRFTNLDPTLPRIDNVPCPNATCITNSDKNVENEVIYIRYDDTSLKYVYLCAHCNYSWKTNETI